MPNLNPHPKVLIIAGSDPVCGAGVQADLKTVSSLGGYACMAITSLVVENTQRVVSLNPAPPELIESQCEIVFEDMDIASVKIGVLPDPDCVKAVAGVLRRHKPGFVVLDPVLVATTGGKLTEGENVAALMKKELFPLVDIVTPNIPELAELTGVAEDAIKSEDDLLARAGILVDMGAKTVIAKGGHLSEAESVDWLRLKDGEPRRYATPRVETKNTHGSGCTFSSAIAVLRPQCPDIYETIAQAKEYIQKSLVASKDWKVGKGFGPLCHFHPDSRIYDGRA